MFCCLKILWSGYHFYKRLKHQWFTGVSTQTWKVYLFKGTIRRTSNRLYQQVKYQKQKLKRSHGIIKKTIWQFASLYNSTCEKVVKFIPKLNNKESIPKLTIFYNTIAVDSIQYGPQWYPVILDPLPDLLKLTVTRKLGQNFRSITKIKEYIKSEVEAIDNYN